VHSLRISLSKCHFFCIYFFVNGALIHSVLCFLCGRLFLCVPEKFIDSSNLSATVCKCAPFCFVALKSACVYFASVGEGISKPSFY
jgi:hypothetical protein